MSTVCVIVNCQAKCLEEAQNEESRPTLQTKTEALKTKNNMEAVKILSRNESVLRLPHSHPCQEGDAPKRLQLPNSYLVS
jgi:hypothetical protein